MPSRGRDLKREIDLITAYLVTLRNMTKLSPIIVQQVNREQSTMERRKQGLSDKNTSILLKINYRYWYNINILNYEYRKFYKRI